MNRVLSLALRLLIILGLALLSNFARATSGCTAVYALTNAGTTSRLHFIDASSNSITDIYTFTGMTDVNALALDPTNGWLYYINRSSNLNDLYVYNPALGTNTFLRSVTKPNTSAVAIGASVDSNGRLFLLYSNYQMQEMNKATGAVIRTITINFPARDTATRRIYKQTSTSGDLVFVGTTLYAALDGYDFASDNVYFLTVGVPGTTTAITATSAVRLTRNGSVIPSGDANGIATSPISGITYLTGGTSPYPLDAVNTTSGVATTQTTTTNAYSDLASCSVPPDPPTLSKSFASSTIRVGASTTLTITLGNTNPTPYFTQATLTDTLPAGMVLASPPSLSTTCTVSNGGSGTSGATAVAGASSLTLPSSLRVPNGGCSYTVSVTGTTSGSKLNSIPGAQLDSTIGSPSTPATASLMVNAPVTSTVTKTQRLLPGGTATTAAINAKPGDTIEYCLSATHPGIGTSDATTAALSDTLNSNLSFVTGAYGGKDVQLTKGSTVTTLTYAADTDAATVTGPLLSVNILPFGAANPSASICFQARVK